RSFVEQGLPPPQLALDGLAHALELAPYDLGLRVTLAVEQVRHRQFAEARKSLGPLAYNPHGGGLAAAAQRVLARLDSDPNWDGRDVAALARSAEMHEGPP